MLDVHVVHIAAVKKLDKGVVLTKSQSDLIQVRLSE